MTWLDYRWWRTFQLVRRNLKPKQRLLIVELASNTFYTPLHFLDSKDWGFGRGHEPFLKHSCPVSNCYITDDIKQLPNASDLDAIVFHIGNVAGPESNLHSYPRKKSQRFVMFLLESPLHYCCGGFNFDKHRNVFNMTMTYRRDSDIYMPYGWVKRKTDHSRYPQKSLAYVKQHTCCFKGKQYNMWPAAADWTMINQQWTFQEFKDQTLKKLQGKKLVAWLVSNCNPPSDRMAYVNKLKKHIPVDIFGKCGKPLESLKSRNKSLNGYDKLGNEYKFILAFENSVCKDYVSEKFYHTLRQPASIPVVLGGSNYSNIAPANSFIDATKFTPKELADHLLHLDKHPEEMVQRLSWHQYYDVMMKDTGFEDYFCRLCELLHNSSLAKKSYPDMNDWWKKQGDCKPRGQFPWS